MSEQQFVETLDLPPSAEDGKVVAGRGGRLFLANDANRVLDQHSGQLRFTDDDLRQWQYLLETRTAWLERRGAHHFFLIAPNAHSVYPDMLPEGVASAPERPVHQLLGYLREQDSYVRITYPLEALAAAEETAYAKTGSHWSEYGASVASRALVDDIAPVVPVDQLPEDAFEFLEATYQGDLGVKMTPKMTSTFVLADPRSTRSRQVYDNNVRNTGRIKVFERDDADDGPQCLVYGDSFANRVLPFLAESFGRLTFAHMVTLDFDLVRKVNPDVVVLIMNERFMIRIPVDAPAQTQASIAAEKIAAGDVLPERRRRGPGQPVVKPG